jgi:ATP-binding cassette, subfamily C, bacteriocin exporter
VRYCRQLDETDCGAACLAMIASHFRSRYSIASIREIAGTDRNGTNLNGMVIAAQKMGFSAKAVKGDIKAIEPSLPVPFIAHLWIEDENGARSHYVVVKKISKNKLSIYNPDSNEGKTIYTRQKFEKWWTGYALFLVPNESFTVTKETKGLFTRFLPLLKPHISLLIQVCIISLLLVAFGIAGSLYFRYLIDEVLFSRAKLTLQVLSIGVMVLTLFQVLLGAVRGYFLTSFSMKVDFQLIFSYFRHVLHLPIGFFDSRKTGEILSRMQDAEKIRGALTEASISVVMDTLMVVVVGVTLFMQSRTLFQVAVLAIPLSTLIIWICAKPFARQYRKLMGESADVHSYLVEALNGNATVKALNAPDLVFNEYEKRQMKAGWTKYRLVIAQTIRDIFTGLINGWGVNVIFWVGSYLILQGEMSLGELVSFNALLGYFLGPLGRLLNLQPNLQEAFVAADRLGEILDLDEEIPAEGRWLKPAEIKGRIEIIHLNFRYGTRRLILEDISASIDPGQWIAFVGSSGCGKTSLVKLLLKLYKPEKGEIRLDGDNLEDIDTIYLRSKIGYVPQEIFLFSGTIADNIALHHPDATLEEITEAAKRAGAHEFISEQPDRYNTVLSERGASLSGGERQRLALARALLGKPEVLIFDEATSNLDTISEYHIHETLGTLRDSRITTILIAHRLTTVINCDRIFVMDKGKIIESGTHTELIDLGGLYSQLWNGNTV